MQKSLVNRTHTTSLPKSQRLRNTALLSQKQQKSFYSFKGIKKQSSLMNGIGQIQSKKVSLPNISFNIFRKKLSQYLHLSECTQHQAKNRYGLESSMANNKEEKVKFKMFRSYKKKKRMAQFNNMHQEIVGLVKDFNVKQLELKNRQSIDKKHTFYNIAVKRDCLRYFGQNACFQKTLQFRQISPILAKNQKIIQVCSKQINEKQFLQASLQYSVQDIQEIKVQPWSKHKEQLEEKEISEIEDIQ